MQSTRVVRGVVIAVGIGAMLVLSCSGSGEQPVVTPTSTVEVTPTPTATATPSPTSTPAATQAEIPTAREPVAQVGETLQQFIDEYGFPPGGDFARLRIPVLRLDVPIAAVEVEQGQAMPDPVGPAQVVWYDLRAFTNLGGEPGEGGNAIFSGQVDFNRDVEYAGVFYRGAGIFYHLEELVHGDLIEIDYKGQTLRYRVVWNWLLEADPAVTDWGPIWRGFPTLDEITLYTSGGDFDAETRNYLHRVVIRAVRE